MPKGKLEVLLVGCRGLEDTDFLSDIDPYVTVTCRTQEQKSSVASGRGSEPQWNETFVFTVTGDISELTLKIMDKDTFTADDFVGEATIPLEPLFIEGSLPPTAYSVVKDQKYRGEIRVGLTFTPEDGQFDDYNAVLLVEYLGYIAKRKGEEMVMKNSEARRRVDGSWKGSSYKK